MGEEDGCDGSLEAIIWRNCPCICSGKVHLTVSKGISKIMALATTCQQAHAF